jgi:hypothetical protein
MTLPGLAALLADLPDGTLLPVGWLRAQLATEPAEGATAATGDTPRPDLTPAQFGALLGRSASTARLWCEAGKVPGAWKLAGRSWRIPAASVDWFRESHGAPAPGSTRPTAGDLSDWQSRKKAS